MSKKRDEAGVIDYSEPGVTKALLVGFDVDSSKLHLLHKLWLDDNVVSVLAAGGAVTLVGYASRKGSPLHNLNLSRARANAVIEYLRGKTVRGVYSNSPGDARAFGAAVGEHAAKVAGVKDRTENPYYRSVHVMAWWKPVPPPPQQPPTPKTAKKVVTHRRWQKDRLNAPLEDGDRGAELGEVIQLMPDLGVSKYASVPTDYVVNGIRDEFTIEWKMIMGASHTTYTREITYTWGARAEKVHLLKQQRQMQHGGRWDIITRGFFSRSEVWKHTIAPDAPESGI